MSTQGRTGIRAARTLLSLLEENSAEELEAAESILGNQKELVEVLRLVRQYKEHEEQPLSVDRLREIVRKELIELRFSPRKMEGIVQSTFGEGILHFPKGTVEDVVNAALQYIETQIALPSKQVTSLLELLIMSSAFGGAEVEAKITSLLRDLAIQALTENTILFPTLHALAQLRLHWAESPLPYQHQEPRQRLVTRLLRDAERLQPEKLLTITSLLLREGLRGPADGAIAAVRKLDIKKTKKAHGE